MDAEVSKVDMMSRGAKFVEKAPADIVNICNNYLHRLTDDIYL